MWRRARSAGRSGACGCRRVIGSDGGVSGTGSRPGSGSVIETSCLVIRPACGIGSVLLMGGGLSHSAVERLEALEGGEEAAVFLRALASRGRSSYTLRTYALGLAHFLEWLSARATRLADVERGGVGAYVAASARNEVDVVVLGRAAATVNHRVSVLASLFAWLVERDQVADEGPWLA